MPQPNLWFVPHQSSPVFTQLNKVPRAFYRWFISSLFHLPPLKNRCHLVDLTWMAKLFALPPFSSMGTRSNKCLTVRNTTEANATLSVYISEMYSKGRNKSIYSPLFQRNVLFYQFFFFPCSSIKKLTALTALSAEVRRPEKRCRRETREGEIWGQGSRRRLPRLLITSRPSATYGHFAFFFFFNHPDMEERNWELDPDSSPLVVTNSHSSRGNNLQQGPSLRAQRHLYICFSCLSAADIVSVKQDILLILTKSQNRHLWTEK